MSTFPTAVKYDIPVIDGDAMGRAYPTMYHCKSIHLENFDVQPPDAVSNFIYLRQPHNAVRTR